MGLFPEPVPLGDVQGARLLQLNQQGLRSRAIVSVAFQLGHDLALPHDIVCAEHNLFLGFRQALQDSISVHLGH